MTLSARTIMRNSCRQHSRPLNILSFPTHERYQTNLAKTGHNFYLWQGSQGIKPWVEEYAGVPEGTVLMNPSKGQNQIPDHIDIDLILSQNKFGQFSVSRQLSEQLGVPLVSIEHTLPMSSWPQSYIEELHSMQGDINIFISDYSRAEWGWSEDEAYVIHHGIDSESFCPPLDEDDRSDAVLSVVNDWINRDWCCGFRLWQSITDFPNNKIQLRIIGDTPGLSKPAKSTEDLITKYQQSRIFLNTSLISPVPTALLEAMSCGCAVVTTGTCMIPEIIKNGENGFMSNDVKELRGYVDKLLNDKKLCSEMGKNARNTIIENFGINNFVESWNEVFSGCVE